MNKMVSVVPIGFNRYSVVGRKFSITFQDKFTAIEFCKQKGLIIKEN